MIRFLKDYFWKQVKKYGLKLVIIGGIGKIISMTTVFIGIPYWFWNSELLPENSEPINIYLHPDSSNESHINTIKFEINRNGGFGGVMSNSMWLRGWDERIKPGKYVIDDKITMGETAENLAEKYQTLGKLYVIPEKPTFTEMRYIALNDAAAANWIWLPKLIRYFSDKESKI